MKWTTFIQVNFDKLLLTVMWVVQLIVVLLLVTVARDMSSISWARELTGTVVGALIGIITGASLGKTNGWMIPPNTTNVSSTTVTSSSHEDTEQTT